MAINIPAIDIQDAQIMPSFRVEEFNRRVTEYAKNLWVIMAAEQHSKSKIRPLRSLNPEITLLCGIVNVAEDDLDGDKERMEYLEANV